MWRMARAAALAGVGVLALAPATARGAPLPNDSPSRSRFGTHRRSHVDARLRRYALPAAASRSQLSVRTLDAALHSVDVSQGLIIGTGSRSGLAVFDRDGILLYRRFADRSCGVELVHRGRVYARVGGERRVRVLELASGKQLGSRAESPPRLLLGARG